MAHKEAIRYYFSKNYDYSTILLFLKRGHGIRICKIALLNRLKQYGLRDENEDMIKVNVAKFHLKYGINVSRTTVQALPKDLDPEGTKLRKAKRLTRRKYSNPGSNRSALGNIRPERSAFSDYTSDVTFR